MSDQFTEYSDEGWFSRIGGAIKGVAVGALLVIISIPVLFWNEGRAVKRAADLEAGRGAVISVKADKVDPSNEGKLVHVSAALATAQALTDTELGVTAPAVRLTRSVQIYQWIEKKQTTSKKNLGGKKVVSVHRPEKT